MSIHSRHLTSAGREVVLCQYRFRNWRSAEREAVVCQYTVDTGDQPNGRLLYFNTW